MADYHILQVSKDGDRATVAFHITVPVETNAASKDLSDAIVEAIAPATEVPWIPQGEQDAVAAGTVYEHVESVTFSANLDIAGKTAVINARGVALQAVIPDRIRAVYRFWGYDGTVT